MSSEPEAPPEVSVIVPVHDTMAYLAQCLDSLVDQTLARTPGAVEVLAIDDGSSDGSEKLLDEYAARHPELFRVEHLPASGGPATPRNRALELARGRYVFFLDSDDHLWDQALERLVRAAEEWDSDVVFGTMTGLQGRGVYQTIYRETLREIDLSSRLLPYSLSVTKLFRRSLVASLRFDPSLRIGSDQPFAVRAMLAARRISLLTDHTYYYAVKRADESNITYAAPWRTQLQDLGAMVAQIAAAIADPEVRDNVLARHFDWELDKVVRRAWDHLSADERDELIAGIAALADAHLSEGVALRLPVRRRLVHRLAQARRADLLGEVLACDQAPLALTGHGAFLAFPGYGEQPAAWYDVAGHVVSHLMEDVLRVRRVHWEGARLVVEGRLRVTPASTEQVRIVLVPLPKRVRLAGRRVSRTPRPAYLSGPVTLEPHPEGARFTARLDCTGLVRSPAPASQRWGLRIRVVVDERTFDVAIGRPRWARTQIRQGLRFYRIVAKREGELVYLRRRRVPLRTALADRMRHR